MAAANPSPVGAQDLKQAVKRSGTPALTHGRHASPTTGDVSPCHNAATDSRHHTSPSRDDMAADETPSRRDDTTVTVGRDLR